MTPRQLTYFLRISELGSFSRAAAVLFVAQPALSRQIKLLEQELGVALFVRSDTGVRVTEAGELLAERARALLQQFESVRNEVSSSTGVVRGSLAFGMPPSLSALVTLPLVLQYRRTFPSVKLLLNEGISSDIYRQVLAGSLDAGIVSSTESMKGLEYRDLIREPLCIATQHNNPLSLREDGSIDLEEAVREPLLLTPASNAIRQVLEAAVARVGSRTNSVFESNSTRLLARCAGMGLGRTVNPYSALHEEHREGDIRVVRIAGLNVTWSLIFQRDRGLTVAGRTFVEHLVSIAERQISEGHWTGAQLV